MNNPSAAQRPVDLAGESVAGEEDPGASIDLAAAAARQPTGTPGISEDVCYTCGGTGRLNGSACPECEGTGKINAASVVPGGTAARPQA
jgi:RecJ-like exonuclease